MSAHIVKVKAVLVYFPGFLPSPFPPRYTFFFCLHEGQDPEKLVFLNPPVTGQESCQSEECKQRLQNAPPPLLANRDVRLVTIQGSAQLARGAFARHFADEKREKGRRKWEGRQAMGGRRGEQRERGAYLRFHVLLQPPQFADKGCRCQGDLTEKGKVSGCVSPVLVQWA